MEVNIDLPARKQVIQTSGKRKSAIAKATIKSGKGRIRINNLPVEIFPNNIVKTKMMEPLILSGDIWRELDMAVSVSGGGYMGQAEAVRTAIARGLTEFSKKSELKRTFLDYDRTMLAGDPRRNEPKKFGGKGARRRRQKSYR